MVNFSWLRYDVLKVLSLIHLDWHLHIIYRFLQGPETDQATVNRIRDAIKDQREITVQLINYTKSGKLLVKLEYLHSQLRFKTEDKSNYWASTLLTLFPRWRMNYPLFQSFKSRSQKNILWLNVASITVVFQSKRH